MSHKYPLIIVYIFLLFALAECRQETNNGSRGRIIITDEIYTPVSGNIYDLPTKSPTSTTVSATISPIGETTASPVDVINPIQTTTLPESISNTTTPSSNNMSHPLRLYEWNFGFYGFHDPFIGSPFNSQRISGSSLIKGPRYAFGLAFSQFTNKVAYLAKSQPAELWVGDVDLENAQLFWTDHDEWLGDLNHWGDGSKIYWILDDQFLLLESDIKPGNMVIVNLATKDVIEWSGQCNILAKSPYTNKKTIWCPNSEGTEYLIPDWDGKIYRANHAPEHRFTMKEWSFSKGGEKIAYATENDDIFLDNGKETVKLPITYVKPDVTFQENMKFFKWTIDGGKVLIYGDDHGKGTCTKNVQSASQLEMTQCWLLFDSNDGKVLWSPTEQMASLTEQKWKDLSSMWDTAISPDGEWIVMTLGDFPYNFHSIMTSTITGKSEYLNPDIIDALYWSN